MDHRTPVNPPSRLLIGFAADGCGADATRVTVGALKKFIGPAVLKTNPAWLHEPAPDSKKVSIVVPNALTAYRIMD